MAGVHFEQSRYWSKCWADARKNMPRLRPDLPASSRVLRILLGYSDAKTSAGHSRSHSLHVDACIRTGSKPRNPEAAKLLPMLAGPHGPTIAKGIAIQKGIDLSMWKYWPK